MNNELENILSAETGWGSFEILGLTPEGIEQIHRFSHASAMGSLFERYKYSEVFGKPLPKDVQRFHPVIISRLCRYSREVGIDIETLLRVRH